MSNNKDKEHDGAVTITTTSTIDHRGSTVYLGVVE